jgi:hypothetical protein
MTSRHPRRHRERTNAVLHAVPPLELSATTVAPPLVSAVNSGARTEGNAPRCPKCGHGRKVFKWFYWPEQDEHIYGCAQSAPDCRAICGNLWLQSRRSHRCSTPSCRQLLRIIENGVGKDGTTPVFMYYCSRCGDHSM